MSLFQPLILLLSCCLLTNFASSSTLIIQSAAPKILVFSKTAGFRHTNIPQGISALQQLGATHHILVEATEDAAMFTAANLSHYWAVVFLSTTGDVLNASQKSAFMSYIRGGGGFVGIHSAVDTEYNWTWYGDLIGAYFSNHPDIQSAKVIVETSTHPSTNGLPNPWIRTDEWFDFTRNPRSIGATVLLRIDESSYRGGQMGKDHPISWYRAYDGGRSWYTSGGGTDSSFSEQLFLKHLLGGILYAAGLTPPGSANDVPSLSQLGARTAPPK